MKGVVEKKFFQKAASLSEKIATGNNLTFPILNAVLVTARKNDLRFLSTNLEIALEISIPAKIKKEGSVALPSKVFSNFISSFSNEENIEFSAINENLILSTPDSATTIKGYPVKDFPVLPKVKDKFSFNVAVNDFVLGLKSVHYSVSMSEMKPEINSVFVHSSKNNPLTFVATDSFRLAEKTIPYNFSNFSSFLIPYKGVVEIIRIFEGQGGDLKVILDENNIVLLSDKIKFTSRLTEGNFLNYKEIIPSKDTAKITVSKRKFGEVLKSAVLFCGKLNEIKIKTYSGEDFLEFQTRNPDLGEHTAKISCKVDEIENELSVLFNHRYLQDCLSSINSEKVLLRFNGDKGPLLITGFDDSSFRYLVMPMKNV